MGALAEHRTHRAGLGAPALLPAKLRPHVVTAAAADLTDKPVLDVEQPDIVAPAAGVRFDVVGAAMIASVDQPIAYAGGAHFAEGDLLRAVHVG
jgi:hypothetical protein